MMLTLDELKQAVDLLPLGDRRELAEYASHVSSTLECLLDRSEAEWEAILDRRTAEIHGGEVTGVPASEVLQRIAER